LETVNLAFTGCGGIAGAHLKGLKALYEKGYRDFRVIACCDIIPEKAEAMAGNFEQIQGAKPAVYSDFEVMLDEEANLDAVGVFTPHDVHHIIALGCIAAGKQVMTEKPLAFTLRAGKKVMDAAKEKGVLLHVAENYRLGPSERAANWVIKSGRIGSPRLLNWMDIGERKWYWQWRDHKEIAAGGWTLDGGVHFSDLFQYHIGDIDRVSAVSTTYDPIKYIKYKNREEFEESRRKGLPRYRKTRSLKDIDPDTLQEPVESNLEDTTSAILEFSCGVIGTWVISRAAPGKVDRSSALYGSEGVLSWQEGIFTRDEQPALTWQDMIEEYMSSLSTDEKEKLFPFGITDTFAIEEKQFIDCILGRGPVEVDAWTGYKDMAIPMAIYESAAIGQPVKVQDVLDLKVETYQGELNKIIGIE